MLPVGIAAGESADACFQHPAALGTLQQGPFEGASYVNIGTRSDSPDFSVGHFYPDSLAAGDVVSVSVYAVRYGGGAGAMTITRVTPDEIEAVFFSNCVRLSGDVIPYDGPCSKVQGGFHVSR